ncbi:phosphoribosyltransferase [Thioalkalivibrio sp. XN8]|uniref:phosphoribosyltransferase n=1 Tax=Thioalkalivibrio sp. XN8 TaxID=2712863 RepID=UPI003211D193
MRLPIPDRRTAGRALAALLVDEYQGRDVIVLGLPRGGVPVAAEIARALEAPLDVLNIRKLGVPFNPELAMGAIASGGIRVLNPDVLRRAAIGRDALEEVVSMATRELERRERLYRGDRARPSLAHRTVVLVDDGVATGASMEAAIEAVRQLGPERVVAAIAVAPPEVVERLEAAADEVVCLATPEPFFAVGAWYQDFGEVSDEEVRRQLRGVAEPA